MSAAPRWLLTALLAWVATAAQADPPPPSSTAPDLGDIWRQIEPQAVPAAAVSQPAQSQPIRDERPLLRRQTTRRDAQAGAAPSNAGLSGWVRTGASLIAVIGLILLLSWGYRIAVGAPTTLRSRQAGLIELLGRANLTPRHAVHLVRVGPRVVLVGISGDRMAALDVVADREVAALLGKAATPDESHEFQMELERAAERELAGSVTQPAPALRSVTDALQNVASRLRTVGAAPAGRAPTTGDQA